MAARAVQGQVTQVARVAARAVQGQVTQVAARALEGLVWAWMLQLRVAEAMQDSEVIRRIAALQQECAVMQD